MTDLFGTDRVRKGALISTCGKYRYRLSRTWDASKEAVVFIMLNPSTADADNDDPTIRRCMDFAKRWGYGGLVVLNLFAFRATKPEDMLQAIDPVGPHNAVHVLTEIDAARLCGADIVCAWGTKGGHRDQDLAMLERIEGFGVMPKCLGVTKDGHPKHPLYVPAETALQPYQGRKAA